MIRLQVHPQNPQGRYIQHAANVLNEGGLIVYPTDTVYGLGCNLFNKKAVERIYQIKGAKKRMRLSFICSDLKNIAQFAHVSTPAYKIMRSLLPGPFTFILKASRLVPKILLEKRKTVGIRVPDNKICHDLLSEFGNPIISTSLNLPGKPYLNDPDEIEEIFYHNVDLFVDAGFGGIEPSTIIELSDDQPTLLRAGKGADLLAF